MILHPEDPRIVLTDRFGTPFDVGDKVVIAAKRQSYGSNAGAILAEGKVVKLTPLMPHPNRMGHWHPTSARSRIPMVREDQLSRSYQTEYLMPGTENGPVDFSKALVAAVQVEGRGRAHTVPYGWNLIRVPV